MTGSGPADAAGAGGPSGGLDTQVARCLDAFERGDHAVIEQVCREHPEHAATIRSRIERLRRLGMLDEARPPAEIGPYRILEKIGAGGMGEVWLAEQRAPVRRRVALKVIKRGMDTDELIRRFELERQAMAVMDHPHIATVLDAGSTDDGRPYIVMEYAPGLSITKFCDERQLTTDERLEVFLDVCDAVHHAHQKGIIHRDIKPSNIIVSQDGDTPRPKVIDFGVAKAMHGFATDGTLYTELGRAIGTREYMSPEQTGSGLRDIDTRTDIYSLGVLLHELLTGTLPFDPVRLREASDSEWQRIVCDEPVRSPSTRLRNAEGAEAAARARRTKPQNLVRKLRGELDWIVLKALEKDRGRRYAAASQFAADIRRYRSHQPVTAGPPSRLYALRKFIGRNRVAVTAGLVVVVAGVAAAAGMLSAHGALQDSQQRYRLLAMSARLQRAQSLVPHLQPAWPGRADALALWVDDAERLVAGLPRLDVAIAELQERLGVDESDAAPGDVAARLLARARRAMAEEADAFLLRTLRTLRVDLQGFAGRDGDLPRLQRRLVWAREVARLSVEAHAAAWRETAAAVAAEPRYRGLQLAPQMGLVPIGRDPASGLFEFAHPRTGRVPSRDADGRLQCDGDTSVVFVLVPPGTFLMGAQNKDPAAPNYDPMCQSLEGPVHEEQLAAFFLAKHELNRAQWCRMTGLEDPSWFPVGERGAKDTWPVDTVDYMTARAALAEYGLELPSEARWEYACRAGSSDPWWTGANDRSLIGAANLGDDSQQGEHRQSYWKGVDDGHAMVAPVHSMKANAFGLHHVHGNVWEWCEDLFRPYFIPAGANEGKETRHVYRGGSYLHGPIACRAAMRWPATPKKADVSLGIRPARSVR